MTAVDRLAAIIEKALIEYAGEFYPIESWDRDCAAAYVAAVIASADDLAVVSLPKPDDEGRAVWRLDPAAKPGYPDGSYVRTRHWPAGTRIGAHGVSDMRVPDAERAAAALLAAVKAAEGVEP